jgi:hypothetical protein
MMIFSAFFTHVGVLPTERVGMRCPFSVMARVSTCTRLRYRLLAVPV